MRIRLTPFGWYTQDETTGDKDFSMAKKAYHTITNWRLLGNVTEYKAAHSLSGLTDDEIQRDLDKSRSEVISDVLSGCRTMDGKKVPGNKKWEPKNLPFDAIINVASKHLIEIEKEVVDGKLTDVVYLIMPIDEEAMAKLTPHITIDNGQHSSLACSDNFIRFKEKNIGYDASVYVYLDLSAKERAELFDNKNFSAKPAPSDQKLEHQHLRGMFRSEEDMLWNLLDIISSERVNCPDGIQRYSVMKDGIKTSQKQSNSCFASKKQIFNYSMYTGSKSTKNPMPKMREKNLITALTDPRLKLGKSMFDYASGLNTYAIAANSVLGRNGEEDINIFVPNTKHGIRPTKTAISIALAQPCAEIIAEKKGLKWDMPSLRGIMAVLKDNVMGGHTMMTYNGLVEAGGSNMHAAAMSLMENLKNVCKSMSAEQIKERGKACA